MSDLKLDSTLRLIDIATQTSPTWDQREYGAVLAHFLRADIRETASMLDPVLAEQSERVLPAERGGAAFDRMLRFDPAPPLPLLRLVKQIANTCLQRRDLGVPLAVGEVLYYLAFASAFVHHHCWITSLDREHAQTGLAHILDYEWIGQDARAMLTQCLDQLTSGEG